LNSIAFEVLQRRWDKRPPGAVLVFQEYHDGPGYLSKPAHWFPEIVKAAGIEDFTWHSLRHDFASQLVMKGVDLRTVQQLMCHASIKQTAIYADLSRILTYNPWLTANGDERYGVLRVAHRCY
jgi:integrase